MEESASGDLAAPACRLATREAHSDATASSLLAAFFHALVMRPSEYAEYSPGSQMKKRFCLFVTPRG